MIQWLLAKASELVYDEVRGLDLTDQATSVLEESMRWLKTAEQFVERGGVTNETEALPIILRAVFLAGQAKGLSGEIE